MVRRFCSQLHPTPHRTESAPPTVGEPGRHRKLPAQQTRNCHLSRTQSSAPQLRSQKWQVISKSSLLPHPWYPSQNLVFKDRLSKPRVHKWSETRRPRDLSAPVFPELKCEPTLLPASWSFRVLRSKARSSSFCTFWTDPSFQPLAWIF